jgi:UDP-glucose 4-epimerase
MRSDRPVLITGGAGFIGSHLAEFLVETGVPVRVLDNLSTGSRTNLDAIADHPLLEMIEGDVRKEQHVEKAAAGVDTIFHLAAAVGTKMIITDPIGSLETNIRGVENVLKFARPETRVLLASSSEAYGKNSEGSFSEGSDSVIGPSKGTRWSYAVSKLANECLGLAYWKQRGMNVTVVRFFNVIGPRQTGDYGMVVPRFIRQALENNPITVFGDGLQTRCFIHVGEAVKALAVLAETEEAVGEVVNVGSSGQTSILELAKKIRRLTESSSAIEFISYEEAYGKGFDDMRNRRPDLLKMARFTGIRSTADLKDTLESIIGYFRNTDR